MYFNIKHNNWKKDVLPAMHVRNLFRVNGYYAYYIPRDEQGIDHILNEQTWNVYDKGFFVKTLCTDFNFETANVFQKFGITIPNNISFLIQIDELSAYATEMGLRNGTSYTTITGTNTTTLKFATNKTFTTGQVLTIRVGSTYTIRGTVTVTTGATATTFTVSTLAGMTAGDTVTIPDAVPLPEEGDLLFLPLQNDQYRNKSVTQLNSGDLQALLKSPGAMNYLFEVTYISDKEYIFNGKAYYYRMMCKVYEKKTTSNFVGDSTVVATKIDAVPEYTSTPNEDPDLPPVETNVDKKPVYTQYDTNIDNLLEKD